MLSSWGLRARLVALILVAMLPLLGLLVWVVVALQAGATALPVFALLAAALAGMAVAWFMGHRMIVLPAAAILREAQQLALGNLAARVAIAAVDRGELGQLASTVNSMAESLQMRQRALDQTLLEVGKERAMLDLIINSMSEGVIAVDLQDRFLLFNAAARKMFANHQAGMTLTQWRQGHELLVVGEEQVCDAQDRPLSRALRGESVDNLDVVLRLPYHDDRVLRHNVRPLHDEMGSLVGALAVFTDITERQMAKDFTRDQEQVLELMAGGVPLQESLEAIVRLIESRAPGSLCAIMLCEGAQLRHGAAPSLPAEFNRRIDGLEIAEGAGACGTAAARKKAVVVSDAERDPLMRNYLALTREFDLQACWSTPVLSGSGAVLATFAIYHQAPYEPQARDHALVESAVRLARIAIESARAGQALLVSEARFRELAENVESVFYNRDFASGRFLYVSPAYEELWGRSIDSLDAQPASFGRGIHPDDQAQQAEGAQAQARGLSTHLEYRIIRPDGAVRWIRDHAYPVTNSAGVVQRVVGTARDITERKLADLELARTHRALHMLSRCNETVIRMDDETGLLNEVCRLAVDLGGYRMAWVGFALNDEAGSIVPMARAGHDDGYLASIKLSWHDSEEIGRGPAGEAIRSGQPQQRSDISQPGAHFNWHVPALERGYRSALMLPLRDGSHTFGLMGLYASEVQHFAAEEVKLLQDMADNLAFGIGSVRARQERKRAQQEVLRLNASLEDRVQQRTAQLEFANQQLEAFSYSVSHDLRTPLSAVDGFSNLLSRDLGKGAEVERSRHYLSRIRAGVAQMGELIDALLSLAQVSRTSLRWDQVDLSAMAEAIVSALHEREPERDVLLDIQPGLQAKGDRRLLQQVLANLLGNAWKFSGKQSQTLISFRRESGPEAQDIYVVQDNGAGFDMTYSDKLFGAFERLHTVEEFSGTGVGLATVHRIVTRHGGRVWATSEPAHGATFYFTLGNAPSDEG